MYELRVASGAAHFLSSQATAAPFHAPPMPPRLIKLPKLRSYHLIDTKKPWL
ncbi:hypothetical protein CPter91_1178 [Collimonas pratensis]|uniref:Uncharacterized protein n=1 Tax=Collimonas pratensis TaxID=279113 RepID=A0A127Q1Q0_9BURK|nr:hypothetical protein CPter91_1178 [Collimonas pratensis]